MQNVELEVTGTRTSSRVWYVSSARLPLAALPSLGGISVGRPRVARLFLHYHHSHRTLVSCYNHSTYCTWRKIRRLVLQNIGRVLPSLYSYHPALLLRLRLVVGTIHSVLYCFLRTLSILTSVSCSNYSQQIIQCLSHFPPTYLALHYLSVSTSLYSLIFL